MNRPCIRDLKPFKKGCPEKCWDGNSGCPAWKEYTVPGEPGNPPVILKDCVDMLTEHWSFEALKLLEGNQQATETFRNGMCEVVNGKTVPKMDRASLSLLNVIKQQRQLNAS